MIYKFNLNYGTEKIGVEFEFPQTVKILAGKKVKGLENLKEKILLALRYPISKQPIKELILSENIRSVLVIVEDKTRPNPDYKIVLGTLLEELKKVIDKRSISILIAYGTHKRHTHQEDKDIFGDFFNEYNFFHHNPDDESQLLHYGTLSTGNELIVNKLLNEYELRISVGNISSHSFAGFTGSRKAILPGVSARQTITNNHSLVVKDGVGIGLLENNPIHKEMMEAAKLAKLDFILNYVRNDENQIIGIFCGDYVDAFYKGVEYAKNIYGVKYKEEYEVVIASCGGYPYDINLYQAQKALSVSSMLTKEGGTIILLAQCKNGIGQDIFERWMKQYTIEEILSKKQEEIEVEGHRAYLTAKILKNKEVIVVSDLDEETVKAMKFGYKKNIQEALNYVKDKHKNFNCYILPHASNVIPIRQPIRDSLFKN